MELNALITVSIVCTVLLLLAVTRIAADLILMAAMALLVIIGILSPMEALSGFGNPGVMTIATLFVVAVGLKETGAVQWLANRLLGQPRSLRQAQFRLMLPTSLLSALVNNTAVVAMFIPAVQEWCKRLGLSPSKLLLPLSYIAILGGTCSLIGTSTNLVIDGLLQSERQIQLGLFEIAFIGVPILVVGMLYLMLFSSRLLPERMGMIEQLDQVREYSVEMVVEPEGPLVNKTILAAGLRHLSYGYLAEIDRDGLLLTAVEPDRTLRAADQLFFIGAPECAKELQRIQGLSPANGGAHKIDVANHQRCLVEVVLGTEFPELNKTIRDSRFRTRFNAAILSVSREGKRLPCKLGDISLKVGDTLLLEASDQFVEQYRFRKDFLLVSALNDSTPPDFSKAPTALSIVALMVLLSASELLTILEAAFIAAGLMLATRCITAAKARRNIDLTVLTVIAASFALGTAMQKTGAAAEIANLVVSIDGLSPWLALALVYLVTVAFTEMITNNAAAVLMFPIAMAVADQLGVNVLPFAIAVMIAASASFITPIGYQTNLMVFGPGGYRFGDFVRIGLPLSMLVALTSIGLIPLIWPF